MPGDDLADWKFSVEETSNGAYRAVGIDSHGRSVEATGDDPDALLRKLREWAYGVANDSLDPDLRT